MATNIGIYEKDFIVCEICNKKLQFITGSHLKKHKMSGKQYRKLYPNSLTVIKRLSERFREVKLLHPVTTESVTKMRKSLTGYRPPIEVKKKLSIAQKKRWANMDKEKKAKLLEKFKSLNKGKKYSLERRNIMSIQASKRLQERPSRVYSYCKKGYFYSAKMNKSFYYRSSSEKEFMEYCEWNDDVILFTTQHKIVIKYLQYDKSTHRYHPDFLIKYKKMSFLIEIKGFKTDNDILKWNAAKKYCKNNNLTFTVIYSNITKSINEIVTQYSYNGDSYGN